MRPARAATTSWCVIRFAVVLPMAANKILCRPAGGPRDAITCHDGTAARVGRPRDLQSRFDLFDQ